MNLSQYIPLKYRDGAHLCYSGYQLNFLNTLNVEYFSVTKIPIESLSGNIFPHSINKEFSSWKYFEHIVKISTEQKNIKNKINQKLLS
jgi:hypothetical protein